MRLLGIELGEHEIRIARGERAFGSVRLSDVERVPYADAAELDQRLAALAAPGTEVLTALPTTAVTHRLLVLPFRDARRLARTVRLELFGQLPDEPEDALVAYESLGRVTEGSAVLAVVARQADVTAHRALLGSAGLSPLRVELAPLPVWNLLPPALGDVALLVADGTRSTLSLRRDGRIAGLRALVASADDPAALAAEVRWALAALGGIPSTLVVSGAGVVPELATGLAATTGARVVPLAEVAEVPFPDATACAVAAGLVAGTAWRARPHLVLAAGEGEGAPAFRRSAALALAALVLGVVDLGLVHHRLAAREAALTAAIRSEAAAMLPGARLVAPRAELEAALSATNHRAARRGPGALAVLRELSTRVPTALALDLDELVVEPDAVRLHGRTDSFGTVDALRTALAGSPLLSEVTAEETRATVDGRHVEFRLRALRRPGGGESS